MPANTDPQPWGAGTVTRIGTPVLPPPVAPPPSTPPAGGGRERRRLLWFAGAAGGTLVIGLVLVLAFTLSGGVDSFGDKPSGPSDVRPPLARACPAPTGLTEPAPVDPGPPPSGARTVDEEAGISYAAFGAPWEPWGTVWSAGALEVPYKVGQHFITETYAGGTYHASILSAAVPAADNDAFAINLECVGRQVAADVRAEYYPQPTTMDLHRDERTTLGGRPAWLTVFRLHFNRSGLQAKDELAGVAVIDVGKPTAAVLYVSIPGTHRHFDYVVDEVFKSVRPA